ncbi:MAG: hypothetical protein A2X82_00380 [Geobacteraceae bacterium GWC2_55_20]|nr:MAG: hypothetical protein A2X82_00380 [Geobacteraceae bacterium GWC2_55_20]OGU21000.1 MAG: hypothetical protein A2X85_03775 [Geobacteraceae bacterium GWF2_54_21]HBA73560.1 response regulator [Geobacter sp.]HCE69613.1 response regulator [Geobacter sp.]
MENTATILVVDDEPMSVEMLINLLEGEYRVITARSGQEALEIVNKESIDLILLDVLMPEMDGYEVFRAIRKLPAHRDTPVLYITALGEEECEYEGLELGAGDYIHKPFNPSLVRLRVKNHMVFHQQRAMLAARSAELETINRKLALEIAQRNIIQESNEQLILELRESSAKVKTLRGLIPICAACKKIRDDKGYWNQIEAFLSKHTDLIFSHALCNECIQKLYPGFAEKRPRDGELEG